MSNNSRFPIFLFITFSTLSFYSYGTAMMDYFLLYPSRFIVGENEFVRYHELLEAAIIPISVFPFLVITILNGLLLRFRPKGLSKTLVWISFVFLVLDVISTVFFQAPWNLQLAAGKDVILMQKITDTNWGRVFLESAQVVVVFIMTSTHYLNLSEPISSSAPITRA